MKQKIILIVVGLLVVIFVGYSAFSSASKKKADTYAPPASTQANTVAVPDKNEVKAPITSTPAEPKKYTLAQVEMHKDVSSCWTVVNGQVYDVTSWISRHPGGEGAILSTCGKDASGAFNTQHGGQDKPENVLANFKIGVLSN